MIARTHHASVSPLIDTPEIGFYPIEKKPGLGYSVINQTFMNTELQEDAPVDSPPEDTATCCQTLSAKVDDTVSRTKAYVRQNPLPVMLGALTFGAALGYLMVLTRREEITFRERLTGAPLQTAREAIYAVLAPVASRLHEGYDSTRENAAKVVSKLQQTPSARAVDSWFDQLGRVSSNLKFW